MEEENHKARKAARREYNETLRELVAFVKKRDKRMAKVGEGTSCFSLCLKWHKAEVEGAGLGEAPEKTQAEGGVVITHTNRSL
jgi:hypothetical protein